MNLPCSCSRWIWSAACLLGLQLIGLASMIQAADEPPNVILIMTDDQGYGDFGATGNELIETPNIDQLAEQSASMATFYVSPVCSPTRACLMTGRYNYRTRCIDTWLGRSMVDTNEVTIAEMLKPAGYQTGVFGKWHLGDNYPMRPNDQGFDQSLIHRGGGLAQPSEPRENNRRYTDPILFRNGEQVQTEGYCTDVYFQAARDFIRNAASNDEKFFVYLPTNAPHGPFHDVPERLLKHYQKKDLTSLIRGKLPKNRVESEQDKLARIAAMITNVDENVGRLLKTLKEIDAFENTLVIVMVDNGPNSMRYVGPFRGMKSNVFEGGIRTPLWMHWPARLKAGTERSEPAAHIDLLPTILDACQTEPVEGVKLDGRSFLPLLTNPDAPWTDRTIAIQSHRGDQPTRYHNFMIRDSRWKLLHPSGFGSESFQGAPQFELYDLIADPGEENNLISAKPDIAKRLQKSYDAWFDDVSSTRPDNYAPPRIIVGTPHENPTVLTRQDWRGGSWQADSNGHWAIKAAKKGRYNVRLEFDAKPESGRVTLSVNGKSHSVLIPAGATTCEIASVDFPEGDIELTPVIEHGRKQRGVYQVVLDHRGEK